jgi:hypothetical protein
MTNQEFQTKYGERATVETQDVLMRIASNLSDLHIEKDFFTPEEMDKKLNAIKAYIFDYKSVLRSEEMSRRYEEQEMREFHAHLGKY